MSLLGESRGRHNDSKIKGAPCFTIISKHKPVVGEKGVLLTNLDNSSGKARQCLQQVLNGYYLYFLLLSVVS